MKILAVAAHPDDEILGIGGTLLKHINNGHDVYICIVTNTYSPNWTDKYRKTKIEEQQTVDKIMNVKKRFNLDFPTVKLNTIPHGELNNAISEVVNEVKPNIIYTHFEHDINYDHKLVFRAVMVATRPPKKIKVICYETLSETEWGTKSFKPNYWVEIDQYIKKKVSLFNIYASEVKKYPHPRSLEGLKVLAQKRGNEICSKYAEAFLIIRDTW